MSEMKKVLIVDDDVAVTNYFMVFLMQTEIFEPEVENDSRLVMDLIKEKTYDVIMLDLDMPNVTGMEILKMMKAENVETPVLILTGVSDIDLAVRAMKNGAFDYLTKPVDDEHLLDILASAMEMGAMKQIMEELPTEVTSEDLGNLTAFDHLPTQDPTMIHLFQQAEILAEGSLSVFLWGERGNGKSWLAHGIHKASGRRDGPFVSLDCTTYPPDEFSSILFGRSEDWSGEQDCICGALSEASGGTLFINNIEHMSPQVQLRLNHALHSGEFYCDNSTEILQSDVRHIVSSTHDLTSSKFNESFSRDLLYQLMVNSLQIPSLRDRPKDIPLLANFFLEEENAHNKKNIKSISPEFLDLLESYYFPGNIQELRKLILAAVALTTDDVLDVDDISMYSRERLTLGSFSSIFQPRNLHEIIQEQVEETIKYCNGDLKEAARLLDISVKVMNSYRSAG